MIKKKMNVNSGMTYDALYSVYFAMSSAIMIT